MKKYILPILLLVVLVVPNVRLAKATNEGHVAVYTEATGTDLITTSVLDVTWDTTAEEDANFELAGNNTDITVAEDGHYLVMYSIGIESSGTNRVSTQSWIRLNDTTNLRYGTGSSFIRNLSGNTKGTNSGSAILELSADDYIRVQLQRTDDNAGAFAIRSAADSGISLIKLDDTWDYIRSYPSVDQAITGSFADLNLAANDEIDAGTFSRSSGEITLGEAGHYLVTYNVASIASVVNRRNTIGRLTLDDVEISGTRTASYANVSNSAGEAKISFAGIIETDSADQVLSLEILDETNAGNINSIAAESGITVVKIPDTAAYVRLSEAGGGQNMAASEVALRFDTNDELDTSAFGHSTDTADPEVTIQYSGDYLFFHSIASLNPGSSVRESQKIFWEKNESTAYPYGASYGYIRGTSGAFATGSSNGAVLPSLVAGDYINAVQINETADSAGTYQAGQMGLQGVHIGSLFGESLETTTPSNPAPTPPPTPILNIFGDSACTWDNTVYVEVGATRTAAIYLSDNERFTGAQQYIYQIGNGSTVLPVDFQSNMDPDKMYITWTIPDTVLEASTYEIFAIARGTNGALSSIVTDSILFSAIEDCDYPYPATINEDGEPVEDTSSDDNDSSTEEVPSEPEVDLTHVEPGDLIKEEASSVVYYVTQDLKKRPFPDLATFTTWGTDASILVVTPETLPTLPTGEPMLPKGPAIVLFPGNSNYHYITGANTPPREITTPGLVLDLFGGTNWQPLVRTLQGGLEQQITKGRPLVRFEREIPVEWRNYVRGL